MLLRSSYHKLPARRRSKTYPLQPLTGEGWDGDNIMIPYWSKRHYSPQTSSVCMIPNPTPDLDEVVTIDYPNHCKLLLYALLIREIEKPEN